LYTKDEYEIMLKEVILCRQLGCDGVVIGLLNMDGSIDVARTANLVEAAYPLGVTFHRAFDRCTEPFEAMEQIIEIGCERILTSGQQPTVNEGVELIADLKKAADNRIIIMPGSGVRADNIKMLAEKTGCTEFHSSLRSKEKSKMSFLHPAFKESAESYYNNAISRDEVIQLRNALN
jgi:copper homeostasis protein